jgi:hypothetical protein
MFFGVDWYFIRECMHNMKSFEFENLNKSGNSSCLICRTYRRSVKEEVKKFVFPSIYALDALAVSVTLKWPWIQWG